MFFILCLLLILIWEFLRERFNFWDRNLIFGNNKRCFKCFVRKMDFYDIVKRCVNLLLYCVIGV